MSSETTTRTNLSSGQLPPYDRSAMGTPTPSELEEMNEPLYDFKAWKRKEQWLQWKVVPIYIAVFLAVSIAVLLSIFSSAIIGLIAPAAFWLHTHAESVSWLIPVAIFFVLSFPPLFGQNILAIVCGLIWGLWPGFGIMCAGTTLGEIGNYYMFKYCCRARAEKLEKKRPYYACLARVVRDGNFKIALIARYSALPSHFVTAVFAACGMPLLPFIFSAIFSRPKEFVSVYLGVLVIRGAGNSRNAENIISDVLAVVMVLITIVAGWYLHRQLKLVKPQVMLERRRARMAQMQEQLGSGDMRALDAAPVAVRVPEPAHTAV